MGRIHYYGEASDRTEPPEDIFDFTIECPACGVELHEGETVYEINNKIVACENCIGDYARFVEDL